MKKLSWSERKELGRLQKTWEAATDAERPAIKAKMDAIRYGDNDSGAAATPPKKDPVTPPKDNAPVKSEKPSQDKKPVIPALADLPHAKYCDCAELMPMVEIEGKGWMSYETFRTKYPTQDIFDLNPDLVMVMYLDQEKYEELAETADDQGLNIADRKVVVSHCARPLPAEYSPVENAILCGLLYAEAKYDPRIKKLGYGGEDMQGLAEKEFYDDFFDGVIYNRLHSGMTLEEARAHAKGEELPQKAETPKKAEAPKKAAQQSSDQPKGSTPPKAQPPKQPAPKPQPQKKSAPSPQPRKPAQTVKQVNRPPKGFARMTF